MTPEERNTVIEALKLGLESTRLSQSEPILRAIAIMRREQEPWGEAVRLASYSCGRCGCADVIRNDP